MRLEERLTDFAYRRPRLAAAIWLTLWSASFGACRYMGWI